MEGHRSGVDLDASRVVLLQETYNRYGIYLAELQRSSLITGRPVAALVTATIGVSGSPTGVVKLTGMGVARRCMAHCAEPLRPQTWVAEGDVDIED